MAKEKESEGGRVGPYLLGRRYKEVGPNLGRLYEARHVDTGKPVLLFLPGRRVRWRPRSDWVVKFSCLTGPTAVKMEVEEAPTRARATELADVLTLGTAAFQRVEDNPNLQAHLFGKPRAPPVRRHRWEFSRRTGALAGLAVLALGLGVWTYGAIQSRSEPPPDRQSSLEPEIPPRLPPPHFVDSLAPLPTAVAYPLPAKPFSEQAVAPCKSKLGEVEINGGCWLELAKRAPCLAESQAEHQGKCYVPVTKYRGSMREPQSVQP
ncbi:hypothetical protein [Melittangium boletus]|uniref:Uncharacterized protein n=1 Tax=Melittangium boletus DSM 14713 TaxID=1294270 RepID=A0A250IC70_9BACT|nr:hypothetical protein [Melittangium boletus]ATB29439.1 hypothetical protein MEBOL_002888 [Melittangium boletus DSM 14713]